MIIWLSAEEEPDVGPGREHWAVCACLRACKQVVEKDVLPSVTVAACQQGLSGATSASQCTTVCHIGVRATAACAHAVRPLLLRLLCERAAAPHRLLV
jgi:hypothetical protein